MTPQRQVVRAPRAAERGSILLLVLCLSITCTVLAMALVATAEMTLRAEDNADDQERAERGAQSGVEWAAAVVKTRGLLPFARSVTLDTGVQVTGEVLSVLSNGVRGSGKSSGGTVTLAAEVEQRQARRPYAFLSFQDTNKLRDALTIDGMAYFGAPSAPIDASTGSKAVQMNGDLDLVTATTVPAGQINQVSGVARYGVTALAPPAWDTTPFLDAGRWKVPYASYAGDTTLKDMTLTGLVVVTLIAGQKLTLDNLTLNGTLVVPWLYPPALDLLGVPTIEIKSLTIRGGTAQTGNLAILAPSCLVEFSGGSAYLTGSGVCYLNQMDSLRNCNLTGQLLLRKSILATDQPNSVRRPAAFLPDVPVGIIWPSGSELLIHWRGRQ